MRRLRTAIAFCLALTLVDCSSEPYGQRDVAELFSRTPPARDETYRVGSHRIHYVVASTGDQRIVFIHGSPGTWKGWTPYLADRNLREKAELVAVDRPGWGTSDNGDTVTQLAAQAALLDPLVRRRTQPTLLVAHSYGGPIALLMAARRPDAISGVVLIAPTLSSALEPKHWYDRLASLEVIRILLPQRLAKALVELRPLPSQLDALVPRWGRLRTPVTVIQGQDDRQVDPATAEFARTTLSSSTRLRIITVPHAGHHVLWNHLPIISDAILDLLRARTPQT